MSRLDPSLVESAIGLELPPMRHSYGGREPATYALGIGAGVDPLDGAELRYVYEGCADGFRVFPTYAVTFSGGLLKLLLRGRVAGIEFNPMMLVHGEQSLTLHAPLPSSASVISRARLVDIHDKGSGMLLTFEIDSRLERGELLATARTSAFIRGMGGYGGRRGASARLDRPAREPDAVVQERTSGAQALLYRLSGDDNPLHADPRKAASVGFDQPILHGLCTFGFAARAILKRFGGGGRRDLRYISARFSRHVYPGETLITEMWELGQGEIAFQTRAAERNVIALSQARARLQP